VELGEGILTTCAVPVAVAEEAPVATGGPVDLSQLGSLLSSKWKTDVSTKPKAAKPVAASAPKTVEAGQVRSFKLTALNAETKKIALEMI
jgi:small subunit ribosomal protein S1